MLGFEGVVVVQPARVDQGDVACPILGQNFFRAAAHHVFRQLGEPGTGFADGNNVRCSKQYFYVFVKLYVNYSVDIEISFPQFAPEMHGAGTTPAFREEDWPTKRRQVLELFLKPVP